MRAFTFVAGVALLFNSQVSGRALPDPDTDSTTLVEHEATKDLPPRWKKHSAASEEDILHLRVALRHSHKNYLKIASAVSNPQSPLYGQYLSAADLQDWLPDTEGSADAVMEWLESENATSIVRKGDWVQFASSVGNANRMLNTTFSRYSYDGERSVLRTVAYSVPSKLADDIDFIFPTTQFLGPGISRSTSQLEARQQGDATCENSVCPSKIRDKYNITYIPPDALSGSKIGVAGFLENYASPESVQSFLSQYGLRNSSTPYTFDVELVNGGQNPTDLNVSGLEAMLDLDYTMPFTDPLPITYFSTGGRPETLDDHGVDPVPTNQSTNEPYLEFLEYLLAKEAPPQVISMSYSDTEQTVPFKYAVRVCDLFAQLAARGVSVLVASGDGGAAGTEKGDCIGPDGQWHLMPTFPSSCPWITSVGALALWGGAASLSSGGFSNYFGRPEWQDDVVPPYITAINGSHDGLYNKTGRGIPDVAVLGDNFLVPWRGSTSAHDGTSASTPVFASMIALINDIRLRAGKPVLGFLNPLLYSNATSGAFRDVADGFGSSGCANSTAAEPGWVSAAGWDPATGVGEPNFLLLQKLLS